MKAVFPCKGVVVIAKQNVDILANYYESNLIQSQMFPTYAQNNFAVQVGKLNYLPQNSTIILDENTKLLTIHELTQVLAQTANEKPISKQEDEAPIEDNFIMDHPFFQTLKPID